MSNNETNPASKSAEAIARAPYVCAACGQPADDIMCTVVSGLHIFWHQHCKAIISVQLLAPVRQAPQSSILVPGRIV